MNRRLRSIFGLILICSLCITMPVLASTVTEIQKQKEAVQQELDALNKEIKELEQSREAVNSEINSLGSDLVDLLLNLEMLEGDLELKKEELAQAEVDYEAAKVQEEEQYQSMKLRIQYIYEEGDTDYLNLLMEADSFADFINRSDFAQEIHEQDRNLLTNYQQVKADVENLKLELEGEKEELEMLQGEYEEEKVSVETEIAEKQATEAGFENQLADAQKQAKAYKATISAQAAKIKSLQAEAARKAAATAGGTSSTSSTGGKSSTNGSSTVTVSGNSSTGNSIASYALKYVGNPYVFGGTSLTTGTDCSGFTQAVFRNFGISLPRTSSGQAGSGASVSYSDAQAGDLICYSGHVAIYLGNGRIVHASTASTGIVTGSATYRTIISVRRCY